MECLKATITRNNGRWSADVEGKKIGPTKDFDEFVDRVKETLREVTPDAD